MIPYLNIRMKIFELFPKILRESFTDISVQKLGIDSIVKQADSSLEYPAADAIEGFVGIPHNAMEKGYDFGIMQSQQLEDAYSSNPSEKGILIRKQLEDAFASVKEALKSKFGGVMTLYRSQGEINKNNPKRNTLSWTSDPRIAAWFAGINPQLMKLKPITDEQVQTALKKYHDTGEAVFLGKRYVRTTPVDTSDWTEGYPKPKDEFYYDIFDKHGEHLTDGDDIEAEFKSEQEYRQELIDKRNEKLKKVVKAEIPVDDIIWITDRAGQSEFILHNKPGKSGYLSKGL